MNLHMLLPPHSPLEHPDSGGPLGWSFFCFFLTKNFSDFNDFGHDWIRTSKEVIDLLTSAFLCFGFKDSQESHFTPWPLAAPNSHFMNNFNRKLSAKSWTDFICSVCSLRCSDWSGQGPVPTTSKLKELAHGLSRCFQKRGEERHKYQLSPSRFILCFIFF